MFRPSFMLIASVVFFAQSVTPNRVCADIVLTIQDAGAGQIRGTLIGSVILTPLSSSATGPGADGWTGTVEANQDSLLIERVPAVNAVNSNWRPFVTANVANGRFFVNGAPPIAVAPSGFNANGFQLQLNSGSASLFVAYNIGSGAPTSMTVNESFLYNYDFNNFRTGTWSWGNVGGASGDGLTLNITAVPEPNSLALTLLAVVGWRASAKFRRKSRV